MATPGTVTLLFTDIVGSTDLLDQIGDEATERLRRTHFRLLREAVASGPGREVKSLGDGLMVVFSSAVDALSCSILMQDLVHRNNATDAHSSLHIRIGLHIGEPIQDEEDYCGTPVVKASRLCDAGAADQIIASDLVRNIVGSRGSFDFRDLGPLELKGFSQPVSAFELVWAPSAATAPQRSQSAPVSSVVSGS